MSPLLPPPWLYRGREPALAAVCVRWVTVHGTLWGSTMRQGWAGAGQDAHHHLLARPGSFPEPGAGWVAQPGNGMGVWEGGACRRAISLEGLYQQGAGRAVCWEAEILGSSCL